MTLSDSWRPKEAIGEVAQRSTEQQRQRDLVDGIGGASEGIDQHAEQHNAQRGQEPRRTAQHRKRRPGVPGEAEVCPVADEPDGSVSEGA